MMHTIQIKSAHPANAGESCRMTYVSDPSAWLANSVVNDDPLRPTIVAARTYKHCYSVEDLDALQSEPDHAYRDCGNTKYLYLVSKDFLEKSSDELLKTAILQPVNSITGEINTVSSRARRSNSAISTVNTGHVEHNCPQCRLYRQSEERNQTSQEQNKREKRDLERQKAELEIQRKELEEERFRLHKSNMQTLEEPNLTGLGLRKSMYPSIKDLSFLEDFIPRNITQFNIEKSRKTVPSAPSVETLNLGVDEHGEDGEGWVENGSNQKEAEKRKRKEEAKRTAEELERTKEKESEDEKSDEATGGTKHNLLSENKYGHDMGGQFECPGCSNPICSVRANALGHKISSGGNIITMPGCCLHVKAAISNCRHCVAVVKEIKENKRRYKHKEVVCMAELKINDLKEKIEKNEKKCRKWAKASVLESVLGLHKIRSEPLKAELRKDRRSLESLQLALSDPDEKSMVCRVSKELQLGNDTSADFYVEKEFTYDEVRKLLLKLQVQDSLINEIDSESNGNYKFLQEERRHLKSLSDLDSYEDQDLDIESARSKILEKNDRRRPGRFGRVRERLDQLVEDLTPIRHCTCHEPCDCSKEQSHMASYIDELTISHHHRK